MKLRCTHPEPTRVLAGLSTHIAWVDVLRPTLLAELEDLRQEFLTHDLSGEPVRIVAKLQSLRDRMNQIAEIEKLVAGAQQAAAKIAAEHS